MRKTFIAAVWCALALFSASVVSAQTPDAEKAKDIRRLMELTRTVESGMAGVRQGIISGRRTMPQMPERFWQELEKEAEKEFRSEDFQNEMAGIYDKHLTGEDIKVLIAFYETPTGQKAINLLPQIFNEAAVVGSRRGEQIGLRVVQKLRAEGVAPFAGPAPSDPLPARTPPPQPRRRPRP